MVPSDFNELGMTTTDISRLIEAARNPNSLSLPPSLPDDPSNEEVLDNQLPSSSLRESSDRLTSTDNPLHAASSLTASSQRLSDSNTGTLESSATAAVPHTLKEVLKIASLEQYLTTPSLIN